MFGEHLWLSLYTFVCYQVLWLVGLRPEVTTGWAYQGPCESAQVLRTDVEGGLRRCIAASVWVLPWGGSPADTPSGHCTCGARTWIYFSVWVKLLDKLRLSGISGSYFSWFSSYLTNRFQHVSSKINSESKIFLNRAK